MRWTNGETSMSLICWWDTRGKPTDPTHGLKRSTSHTIDLARRRKPPLERLTS